MFPALVPVLQVNDHRHLLVYVRSKQKVTQNQ